MSDHRPDRASSFAAIYEAGGWLGRGSGPGSAPDQASPYTRFVLDLVQEQGIRTVVDLGCGDWQMWPDNAFETVDYCGLDVVESVMAANQERHGSSTRRFKAADVIADPLPEAELFICKEVMQHLPNEDVLGFLARVKSKASTVILCDDSAMRSANRAKAAFRRLTGGVGAPHLRTNGEIHPGQARLLRFDRAPFLQEGFVRQFDYENRVGECITTKTVWMWKRAHGSLS